MDRRKFVSALGLGLGAAALAGCGQNESENKPAAGGDNAPAKAADNEVREWKLVTAWPKNYPGLGTGANRFAERVTAMSGGRLTIKVHGAGELVPAMGVFDAVRDGSAEMGHSASYYWKGKHPATPFFTAVPFGLTAQELNSWVNFGGGQELWDELYGEFGLKPLPCGNSGTQMAGWFRKEINSLEDIKGLKIRAPGLAGEVMQRIGATPVQMPGGEVFTSMQTGALDAADWVGPYNDLTFGLHKVAKYYYYPGWQEPGAMLEMMINKEKWDALPEDLQAIVKSAAEAENQHIYDEFTARNAEALKQLVNEHGVELRRLPDEVLEALEKTSQEAVEDLVAGNDQARRIYESYRDFRDSVMPYIAVAEQSALNVRSTVLGQKAP
ncbi:MAG TPA: ABC transporter substrate-binding protein [Alcanivorax sp.]|jgi:TRAP-type mannitol/chloroaromatic compound transport system substrate-binding protein|uniref:TRAP-type transports system extracellular solute binding protein n=1 Tax=Alloalcanivorax venustensis ISO4 TaxID=1177184 RepID=A0ABS0ADV3_9GAMM|nr:TRAP transporter substrate-binding protein [Alloalcanivorax venustensis]MAQ33877.1 ABC transporter substrate-binding protein [Alcanivorax sp.]MBF5052316.1 TRAP-type transports system extracellular solute binding protein [Alloalcanivorax venustensis ISO4]MCH2553427.1 TRAP transporter substrate-binding protein [Alcanivorax sp.]NQY84698.1 TRAP transporter substrate-binding protein [Alcanivorax sp.]HAD45978.1 ABC transporter substrate-binding protein [Alcanivorax sp.]|tara:strand:- start:2774 stop:3922 length:1149 start_codon:yes stop_codon:yes gene_type:complete